MSDALQPLPLAPPSEPPLLHPARPGWLAGCSASESCEADLHYTSCPHMLDVYWAMLRTRPLL